MNTSSTVSKRYLDPEELDKYGKCKDDGKKKLPFYDAVRKAVNGFDFGFRSCGRKLQAIGFESWHGVGNGWVSAFRKRFESKSQGGTKFNGVGAVNMNEEETSRSPRVGKADQATNFHSNSKTDDMKVANERMNEIFLTKEEEVLNTKSDDNSRNKFDKRRRTGTNDNNYCNDNKNNGFNHYHLVDNFTTTLQLILNVIPNIKPKKRQVTINQTTAQVNSCVYSNHKNDNNNSHVHKGGDGDNKILNSCSPVTELINLEDVGLIRSGAKRCEKSNGTVSVGVGLVLFPPWLTHSTQLIRWKAESKKEDGNEAYKRKEYKDALNFYNEAIDLCPSQASYYGNRSACYMMLGQYGLALEDARQSVKLDETFVKGYIRESKCHLALGDVAAAERVLLRAQLLEPKNKSLSDELIQVQSLQSLEKDILKALGKKDFRTAVYYLDKTIVIAPACNKFKLLKAECLVYLNRYQESQDIVYDIMRADSYNVDAIYVRGLGLYYQDNAEKAFTHFQQALRLAPDHPKAKEAYRKAKTLKQKKEEGNEAFRTGRLVDACDLYTNALVIDPDNVFTNAKLYFNRAIVYAKLNKQNQAIDDCTQAINLDANYTKAYLKRAKCYMDTQMYEEAVRDYEKVCKLDKTRENRQLLQEAKLELKKSKRKDYYKILGISKNASDDEIKKAYKRKALEHHPDRHSSASEDQKKDHEKRFKDLGEAYSILSDPKQRSRYDNGQDLDDMDLGHDFDPTTIFQTFAGPGQFSFGGSSNGFPFSFKFA